MKIFVDENLEDPVTVPVPGNLFTGNKLVLVTPV
jgi:hypothetical protein